MTANTRPDWLLPSLFPFESRFVELDGHRVHYVDEGDGPVLLFLHGNPTWSFAYRHLVSLLSGSERESRSLSFPSVREGSAKPSPPRAPPSLARSKTPRSTPAPAPFAARRPEGLFLNPSDRFRCIALDYPGFGLSTAAPGYGATPESHAAVVARFVDALELRRFAIFAHDWGGPIGLHVATRMPERITALCLGNTWAWPVDHIPHFTRFSAAMGGALGGVAIRSLNAFVNLMIPLGVRVRRLSRDEMRCYRAPLATPARRAATHVLPRAIVASTPWLRDLDAALPRLADKPLLLTWPTADIAFRDEERRGFERRFPNHRVVLLEGAGHFLQEDAPEAIASAIRAFWSERVFPTPSASPPEAR